MGLTGSMEVLNKFRQLASTDRVIRLLNVYKGVPITYDAAVTQVGDKTITLSSHKYQIVCLSKYRETYIQSGWLPLTVRARVVKIDFLRNEAILSDFEYVTSHIGGRTLVRVVPRDPVEVFLQNDLLTGKVRTELVDISLQGIGVHLMSELYQSRAFEAGRDIMVIMDLPGDKKGNLKPLRLKGTVIHSEPAGWFRGHRIGIMLFPGKDTKGMLSDYVRQRQTEIFNEVKIQYDLMARLANRGQDPS
ncbi:MAG: PilZ domain-containing protein [Anaerolineales bacterium]|nr:PilZ domain-containing protein [Anaerolineales bacterium]